jgi:hypothetical protein
VWPKLAKQINVEREQLRRLIEIHRSLLASCASRTPNDIELSALAALYTLSTPESKTSSSALRSNLTVKRRVVRHGIDNFSMRWLLLQAFVAR